MKKNKKTIKKIIASGIWLQPICLVICIIFTKQYMPAVTHTFLGWVGCFIVSFLPMLIVYGNQINKPNKENALVEREKAGHPDVEESLLYDLPEGILFGKTNKKYVCKSLEVDGHVFVLGGSGSHKSSAIAIPTLIANPETGIFAIDIKGELHTKATRIDDEKVLVFDPADRSKYGYNPFYALSEDSSSQQILEVMQNIAFSLIPMPANIKDPFWKTSSRNLLLGAMIHLYNTGIHDFLDIINELLSRPIKETINNVMEEAKPSSAEYRYLVQFSSMEDITLGGIVAEMNNHLVVFANDQDIRFAFHDNYLKINPKQLEEGYRIFISIKEEKLAAYYDVLQLIINQTLAELEKRPENSKPIIVIIDELARILSAGKLDRLLDGARTLRSRKVCLCLITQSVESLMSAYTEHEVVDLISNCGYIAVLSANSSRTQKMVCDWAGQYQAYKQSWSGSGMDTKPTVSLEDKNILKPYDLMTLQQTHEVILISPQGYNRIKKCPYYEDDFFAPIVKSNVAFNENINNLKEK